MYYDSTETYTLKVWGPAWTWGGKKRAFFVPLLESSFPKKDSFIYKCFISVDKSDYLKKESREQKWSDQSHYKSVNLQYITLGCLDEIVNQESDVPSIIFLYFL